MNLLQNIICIVCGANLNLKEHQREIECADCGKKYSYLKNTLDFRQFEKSDEKSWDAEKFDREYSFLEGVEDGFENARRSGIPEFIEDYRILRCKDFIAGWIAAEPANYLLDIGCGTGWFDFRLRDKFGFKGEIAGIDVSPHSVNLLLAEAGNRDDGKIIALSANAEKIPFADKVFDIVVMTEVIEHVADPPTVIYEAARVLKPGGKFIITTPSGPMCAFWDILFWLPQIIKRCFVPSRRNPGDQSYDVPLSWIKIRNYLLESGFDVKNYHKAIFLPHESYLQFFPNFLLRFALWKALVIEKLGCLTNFLGLHHIILAEKR